MEENEERLKEEKRAYARETIETLRPHFMFNVLNQMKYQIGKNPETAQEMVYDLANFFRGSLTVAAGDDMTLLDEELRAFKSYLRLEEAMNRNLKVQFEMENEKGVRHMTVRPGILQEFAAAMIKEEVRVTKQERTLQITDGLREDHYYIHIKIKETGQDFLCPVYDLKGE